MAKRYFFSQIYLLFFITSISITAFTQTRKITNDLQSKKITFGSDKLEVVLDYNLKANISSLLINGQQVINDSEGIFSLIQTKDTIYSTLNLSKDPTVKITGNSIVITGIRYGDKSVIINENWIFTINNKDIKLTIERTLSKDIVAEKVSLPAVMFKKIDLWDGAFLDYGGLAWFYLFNKKSDTYGVHSNWSKFWNKKTGNGLLIDVDAPGEEVAMSYSRSSKDELEYAITVSHQEIFPRLDSGTNRRRFLRDTITNVWAPIKIYAGTSSQRVTFSYFDFNEQYGRGKLLGITGDQVSDVLNTIARIGVIDKNHFGGNSWHTPYGPICLHEQYIAQLGLAINDKSYLKGYQQCLDFYRENAIKPDGRVWSRWAYTNEDAMPGAFTNKGFYEARWGYLLDANPDFVSNVAELYDQTGDKAWVKTHQRSCERVLDWILKRDSNNNGLVEMVTDSMQQKRGSDWIDIIWASYENAFVNAKLYHALVLWAEIEKQLGNAQMGKYYLQFAQKLKGNFNKSTGEGGFWDVENNCYIHWRDKNGSLHGRNMVTPVNFMAIAYGICDDSTRSKAILDEIETQMQKEQLFFWPLCMYSYAPGEGNDWQFPFPNYENGDIFLSWGAVGVKAYASYKPELALKYVKNVLSQYAKDGLAFQRYGRKKQDGLGDDILSGNSLSIIGLYQSIYGVNPLYNRLYLDPHITEELAGTELNYRYRGQVLKIGLDINKYIVSAGRFKIIAATNFGFFNNDKELFYFAGSENMASLKLNAPSANEIELNIQKWDQKERVWVQSSVGKGVTQLIYEVSNLKINNYYTILIGSKQRKRIKTTTKGTLQFDLRSNNDPIIITVMDK